MKGIIQKMFSRGEDENSIVIVSGLPRSGTSLLMKMLEAGGIVPLVDNVREADDDNPRGYYEYEPVKALRSHDASWLANAHGRVVKIIAMLLTYLPDSYHYKVIFVRREMREILASQRKMLINRGEDPDKISDEAMAKIFEKHLLQVDQWILDHPNVKKIDINYNLLIHNPKQEIERIVQFLEKPLDIDKMASVIDPNLYRQRSNPISLSS
jgi:hypothetical protein